MESSIYDLLDIYKKSLYEDWNEKYADKFEFEDYLIAKIYIFGSKFILNHDFMPIFEI